MAGDQQNADIIVAGGGPAGAMLAGRLARAGVDVLVLEKSRFPRPKPCGGGLTEKTVALLDLDLGPVIENRCSIFESAMAGRPPFVLDLARPFVAMVRREAFDQALLDWARAGGARVVEEVRVKAVTTSAAGVTVETSNGEYRGKYVVGADGVTGEVARSLGLRPRPVMGRGIVRELALDPATQGVGRDRTVAMDFGTVARGYGWVFPKKDHCNVGLFTQRAGLSGLERSLDRYLAFRFPGIAPSELTAPSAANRLIPLGGRREPLHAERAILVGDAAGLVDPFTGEGIYSALLSGIFGAEALALALVRSSHAPLAEYTRTVHREMLSNFRSSRLISAVFYSFPRLAAGVLTRPSVVRGYKRIMREYTVRGEIPYARLIREIMGLGFFRGGPDGP